MSDIDTISEEVFKMHPILKKNEKQIKKDLKILEDTIKITLSDFCITCYLFGMISVLNPGTNFNKNYRKID